MTRKYRINEIFYSLQGEGRNTGRAAVFVRFAGCNLKCTFCDTNFSYYVEMTAQDIIGRANELIGSPTCKPMVVLTGGEPTLQVDADLIDCIHQNGYDMVAMESNGTAIPPSNLDWLTVSPKGKVNIDRCNELKCIYNEDGLLAYPSAVVAEYKYVQPCDTGDTERNSLIVSRAIEFVEQHPDWRLSLQTHKMIGFK